MKKFKDLTAGNIVFRCNFNDSECEKYEIINVDDSQYAGQTHLSVKRLKNNGSYYDVNVVMHIDVFNNNSYEYARQLIGCSENIIWVADVNMIMPLFNKYRKKKINKLNNLKSKLINIIKQ